MKHRYFAYFFMLPSTNALSIALRLCFTASSLLTSLSNFDLYLLVFSFKIAAH